MENKIRKAIKDQIIKLKEQLGPRMKSPRPTGPSDPRSSKDIEFDNAQSMSRLTPDDKDKLEKIKQMMDKEKSQKEDYKPSHRAYNVIDKSNNDEIVAKELPRYKALELAKTNKNYMIDATDGLAETRPDWTPPPMGMGGEEEEDEEQEEYDKGWYGESLKEAASKLGYLKEVDGMEGGMDLNAVQYEKAEFVYSEGNGQFYSLNLYTSDGQKTKLGLTQYDEANEWLKDTLAYIHEDDLIPKEYNSGMEDLDLIVDRLKELGIEASHNEYDFS